MNIRKKEANENGQSLLEVLISIVFMGAILLMSLNFIGAGIRGNSRGKEMSAASYLAQQALEDMRSVDYAELPEFDGFITGGLPPGSEPAASICQEWDDNITSELPTGFGEIEVGVTGSLTRISVVVGWIDAVDKERRVEFETLIAERT